MRLAILTNIIAPSRIPILNKLGKHFDLNVLISGKENNRNYWEKYVESRIDFPIKKVFGISINYSIRKKGQHFKKKFIHINPGYLAELFRIKPDAVISIEMGFRSFIALCYCFLLRKPLWIWWGGTLYTERNISILKKVMRSLFKRYPRWISYGKSSSEYLLSMGIESQRILEIQNTIDERPFMKDYPKLKIEGSRPIVLFIGELIQRKGLDLLMRSVSRLENKKYCLTLLVIGDGPEMGNYQSLAKELSLENVKFLGSLNPLEVVKYYKSADFMVFPSLHDVWGLVVNEALWSDLPVLSSKYAGASSDLLDADYIFDPLSETEFDNKLIHMIRNHTQRNTRERLMTIDDVSECILNEVKGYI